MTNLEKEINGFLMGEGCFRVQKRKKAKWINRYLFIPVVLVSLRDDDDGILLKLKEVYGGSIIYRKADRTTRLNANPSVMWIITSSKSVLKVCNNFLKSSLPSKKLREVKLLKELCDMKVRRNEKGHKNTRGVWFTDEEYEFQEFVCEELKRLKRYKSE